MNTTRIRELTKMLDEARGAARQLRNEAEALNLNHQDVISVRIKDCARDIYVAVNGGREAGWMSQMVRGREMIMLGIKKAYTAMIEDADARVASIESEIRKEAA